MHYMCICAILSAWRRNHLGPKPDSALLAGFLPVALPRRKSVARRPASRPLALVASAELGAHAKLALLMLRSIPLQGTTPDRARRRTSGSLCGYPFCYESHARVALSPVEGGQRLGPTARLQRKSAGCGLNGFLPRLCLGPLHLNPRPPKDFGALALSPLRPPWQTETVLPFWTEKLRSGSSFSLQNRIQKIPPGEGRTRANAAQSPSVWDDARLIKKQH
jgi:hypothetical protein